MMAALDKMRTQPKRPIRAKTVNYYLRGVRSFCRWMVEVEKRATSNPMAGLRGVKNPEAEAVESARSWTRRKWAGS